MKSIVRLLLASIMAGVMPAAGAVFADHHSVKVSQKEDVGSFLTDTKGMTLYLFRNDTTGMSACEGECLSKWPLYHRDSVAAKDGLKAEDFGTITRADGQKQTTYKSMPLYYFAGDKAAGDTNGQEVKGVWFVVAP